MMTRYGGVGRKGAPRVHVGGSNIGWREGVGRMDEGKATQRDKHKRDES